MPDTKMKQLKDCPAEVQKVVEQVEKADKNQPPSTTDSSPNTTDDPPTDRMIPGRVVEAGKPGQGIGIIGGVRPPKAYPTL